MSAPGDVTNALQIVCMDYRNGAGVRLDSPFRGDRLKIRPSRVDVGCPSAGSVRRLARGGNDTQDRARWGEYRTPRMNPSESLYLPYLRSSNTPWATGGAPLQGGR